MLTAGWPLLSPEALEAYASSLLGLFLLAIFLPLSWRAALLVLAGAGGLEFALGQINAAKIAMTQAPLTAMDLQVAIANPRGLWLALRWPLWTQNLFLFGLPVLAGCWAALVAHAGARNPRLRRGTPGRRRIIGGVAVALGGFAWFMVALSGQLVAQANRNGDLWEAPAFAAYSKRVGPTMFLLYSYHLEQVSTGVFYADTGAPPLPAAAVHDAATRMVAINRPPSRLPNIVVVFAESTFNPDWAFTLNQPVSSPLFTRQADTHLLTGLYVNAVGGGSWITEFESIVGLDSRLFGYSGYYTHSTLSPFVRQSLATYLRAKGYETSAFYSWAGNFYNARYAYGNYGFDRFLDVGELGMREFEGSDLDFTQRAIARMGTTARRPSFGYLVTYQNHSPHRCEHFERSSQFTVVFANPVGFAQNCELNEYLRRMDSTAGAVEAVHAHLQSEERATGRPYVLVVFGDHQPHTFTSTQAPPFSNFDYASQRTHASARETFLHIRSSTPSPLRCCGSEPPPAFLLPTLISAYAANGVDDLHLPQNLEVFRHCGSEILRGTLSAPGEAAPPEKKRELTSDCRDTYRRWLASIQAAGVF